MAWLATSTALQLAPYLAGVLLPYPVDDLDELPLAEVGSGAHDPEDPWPQGSVSGRVQSGGFPALGITPLCRMTAVAGCLDVLWSGRPRQGTARTSAAGAVGLAAVLAVCIGVLVFRCSPSPARRGSSSEHPPQSISGSASSSAVYAAHSAA